MRKLSVFVAILSVCLLTAGGLLSPCLARASGDVDEIVSTPSPQPTAAPVVNPDFTIEVDLGYEGMFVLSQWMPCFVTVTNNGPDFDGILGVNVFLSQTEYDRYETPLTLASGATKHVLLPIKPQVRQDMYAFELVQGGILLAEARVAPARLISPDTVVIGVLSENPQAVSYMNQRANGVDTLGGETWLIVPLDEDTFPGSSDLMNSFTMLVVDGVDPRTLKAAQQDALTAWLQGGGIVYVSGGAKAASGYPFFAQWTGLSTGKLKEAEDITPDLINYLSITAEPAGESVWLNTQKANGALITRDGNGLLFMHKAGDGLIYSAAFDFGGKPLSSWASMPSFWPRVLRQSASTVYRNLINNIGNYYYDNIGYTATSLLNNMKVRNDESGVPLLVLLAAFLVCIGFGGYLILKKTDKREWLWVAVPALSAVFAVAIVLLSNNTSLNKPVALTASRVMFDDTGAQADTYIGVATPESGELTVQTDQGKLPSVVDTDYGYYYDYYGSEFDQLYRPLNLRQRLTLSDTPTMGFAANDSWNVKTLKQENVSMEPGTLDARLWVEADGVHGEVTNNTGVLLTDCLVVTNFGFCNLGDLMPGQKMDIALLQPESPIDYTDTKFRYQSGVLYSSLDMDAAVYSQYGYSYLYNYLDAAIYKNTADYQDPLKQQMYSFISLFESEWQFYESTSSYYFFGFNDSIGKVAVKLNDEPVTRTAHLSIVGSQIAFEPVGPTGVVMYQQGMIPAEVLVDMGENEKPRVHTDADGQGMYNQYGISSSNTYLTLNAPVALRFTLPEYETYTIGKMTFSSRTYETIPTMYLFNNLTGAWDKQLLLTISMTGEEWAPYIDTDGSIYVRIVPSESANRYEGMNMPTLALKGQVI